MNDKMMRTSLRVGHFLHLMLLSLLLSMTGVTGAWGQIAEGYYYIASNAVNAEGGRNNYSYSNSNPAGNFYLCPAIGSYFGNNIDQPHLTTFKTNQDPNSLWKIEAVSGETDCYHIIHYKTGKYLASNDGLKSYDNGDNRKAVHLEEKTGESDLELYKFYIKNNSGTYQIYPKKYRLEGNTEYTTPNDMSLNPKGDNWSMYVPQNGLAIGIIGLYTYNNNQRGSQWKLEPITNTRPCATPIIEYDGDNIKISYPYSDETDVTLYYTTDGNAPSTSSLAYNSPFPASGVVKVRAIATKSGLVNSDEAVLWGSTRPFLIQSKECTDYYLVPTGNGSNVNTSSLPSTSMQWTLQNGGASVGGVTYYYLVNSNENKIQYAATLAMNSASADDNKFCIVENGYNTGEYFLIPISATNSCVLKKDGNVSNSNCTSATMKSYADAEFGRDKWTLRICNDDDDQKGLFTVSPFTVSDDDATHYYYIASVGSEGYYIVLPAGADGYATTSNASDDYTNNPWIFKVAASDNWLTYYHIINAATGKYMYFNPNNNQTGNQTNVISMKDISESTSETADKYQFIMVRSTTTNACYIVPKGYAGNFRGSQYYGLWRDKDNETHPLKSTWNRYSNYVKWTFEEATITDLYLAPVISQDENGNVSIAHPTVACDIYYTTDGTAPVVPTSAETPPTAPTVKYTGAFLPSIGETQVKAIAVLKTNYTVRSDVETYDFPAFDAPVITFDNTTNDVTISSATEGATIYYTTDGTDPTVNEGVLHGTSPVTISDVTTPTTVKAIAVKAGYAPSDVDMVTIQQVATPAIKLTTDNKVSITSSTTDVTIYYTYSNTGEPAEPTVFSYVFTSPLSGMAGYQFKAIAVKSGWINSDVGTASAIEYKCAAPTYTLVGEKLRMRCISPTDGVTIRYEVAGSGSLPSDPTGSSQSYSEENLLDLSSYTTPITVKAYSVAGGYVDSDVSTFVLTDISDQTGFNNFVVSANNGFEADTHAYYRLKSDVSGGDAITTTFTGTFDGGYHTISGLGQALFNSINGGTVKNVILDPNATISGNGAICNEADGTAKIYNCGVLSGTVSGSGNVGGLVGHIKSGSSVRVVNCYSYANVSGGSTMAGIVGNNEGTVGDVRIAMCMMYGDMSGGTSPVYAGNHTSNVQDFTEYNFWRSKANLTYTTYNDQLAIDKDEYLTRFPFYRHILNTHRELAAYFLFGDYAEDHVNEIGHWAVKKGDDAPKYPIIEAWEKNRKSTPTQTNNDLPTTTADYAGKLLTTMGTSGYLSVSIKIGSNSYSANLPITDMDTLRYDYTYGKVILPFANEYEVNTDYSKICTGWKITAVGSNESASVTNYNFADRDNPQKDIYNESTNPFIYAQGGYYVVPTGVTDIEITANFATAYYLSDATYDVGYDSNYANPTGVGGTTQTTFQGHIVYNNLATALGAMGTASTPHSQAIVLVGNYHFPTETPANKDTNPINGYTGKAFTLMSIDADNNQEPDYGFYSNNSLDRPSIAPIRFDFLPIISLGMAAKVNGSNYYPGVPIWKPRGWYEQTETTVSIMNQFELDSGNFTNNENGNGQNPCIINGGYFVQMVRSNKTNCSKVSYFKIGGNAYIKEFYPGAHSSATNVTTTIVPVNVTGGQVDECFMTGYRSGGKAVGTDIRFWCSGGKIGKFLGAYMDTPMQTSNSAGNVNMTAKVDHALIGSFFGGGTSPNAAITGDINVTINNSKVDFYCGGPEFGNMNSGKVVHTIANNTWFGKYYGAGFGGTSITYKAVDGTPNIGRSVTFTGYTFNSNTDGKARLTSNGSLGLATCYKFEFLMHSSNKSQLVARFITGYAKFDLATTGSVTNELTGCTVLNDFYGAGCQGKVDGTVTSTLTGCTIMGSVFGGGYQAMANETQVYPAAAPTFSVYNGETGIFSDFGTTTPETFTWEAGTSNPDDTGKKLYTGLTQAQMDELGNVTGAISITIENGTVANDVYGGGNESKSLNDATVNLKGNAEVLGNVFGGGNNGAVGGSTTVNIEE